MENCSIIKMKDENSLQKVFISGFGFKIQCKNFNDQHQQNFRGKKSRQFIILARCLFCNKVTLEFSVFRLFFLQNFRSSSIFAFAKNPKNRQDRFVSATNQFLLLNITKQQKTSSFSHSSIQKKTWLITLQDTVIIILAEKQRRFLVFLEDS